MVQLKKYQQKTLEKLKDYLKKLEILSHRDAFITEVSKFKDSVSYNDYFDIPNICIKIPTGGGKTLVGCHSVAEIMF